MLQRRFAVVGVLTLAAVLVPGPLHAGGVQLGGQGGTGTPPGDLCDGDETEGCTVEVDWNPHVQCVEGDDYTDLGSLLGCMLNEEEAASDFVSSLLPGGETGPWGIEIRRLFTSQIPGFPGPGTVEIDRVEIFENDSGIGTTQLTVDHPSLVVRIKEIVEGPDPIGNGAITIELDDDIVEFEDKEDPPLPPDTVKWVRVFDTTGQTALDLNVAISQWLRGRGFEVQYDSGYFVVSRDDGYGFRRVQFRSENAGVISSDIALLPKWDPEAAHLFETGGL